MNPFYEPSSRIAHPGFDARVRALVKILLVKHILCFLAAAVVLVCCYRCSCVANIGLVFVVLLSRRVALLGV